MLSRMRLKDLKLSIFRSSRIRRKNSRSVRKRAVRVLQFHLIKSRKTMVRSRDLSLQLREFQSKKLESQTSITISSQLFLRFGKNLVPIINCR